MQPDQTPETADFPTDYQYTLTVRLDLDLAAYAAAHDITPSADWTHPVVAGRAAAEVREAIQRYFADAGNLPAWATYTDPERQA